MFSPSSRGLADKALLALSAVGIAICLTVVPMVVRFADEADAGTILWGAAVGVLTGALVVGLVLRDKRPALSTGLMVIGAAAPAVAWIWIPPIYLLSAAIAFAAIANRNATDSTTAAS